jgi:hypothetical protein
MIDTVLENKVSMKNVQFKQYKFMERKSVQYWQVSGATAELMFICVMASRVAFAVSTLHSHFSDNNLASGE